MSPLPSSGLPSGSTTRARPSPASTTRPTSSRSRLGLNDSTCLRSAAAMSSGLMESSVMAVPLSFVSSGDAKFVAGLLEAGAEAAVQHLVADADDHRAQNSLVDRAAQVDRLAGGLLERLGQAFAALLVQRHRAADLGHHPPAALGGPPPPPPPPAGGV